MSDPFDTDLQLCKHARALYDWYPTEEDIRRVGYTSNQVRFLVCEIKLVLLFNLNVCYFVLQVILSYREAERVALRAGITPSPLDPLSQTSVQSKPNKQNVKPAETQIVNRPRPALISVMGHANHGKTSLLDALRGTNVVAIEPGNITQQLYVFRVDLNEKGNNKLKESDPRLMSQQDEYPAFQYCTCLESPGQAIFQSLREQAGEVCDIVVLLIDINDGIQEQTLEVLDACIEARVPLLIAFNKYTSC
jgi:small GTP-binding protein